ncbi:MAG: DUF547 domain-containing protein [Bacteroidota bacterium]
MKNSIIIIAVLLMAAWNTKGQDLTAFFQQTDQVLKSHVNNGLVDYKGIKQDANFNQLIKQIATTDFEQLDAATQQAFLVNAYNFLVINEVLRRNVTSSVRQKSDFFDAKSNVVGGKKMSLNTLEKKYLLKAFGDPRFHFVLVCGAKGCPPITNFAYTPDQLDQQLDQQTRIAMNNPYFMRVDPIAEKVKLSEIFSWYPADFGGNKKAIVQYINSYREKAIPADFSIEYYTYDWSLNTQQTSVGLSSPIGNNSSRYVVSAAIPKGTTETKLFNNLYTERTRSSSDGDFTRRANFLTSWLSFLYGVSNTFNAGFDLRYRRVSVTDGNTSPLNVLTNNADSRRHGVTSIGPKIRWAPVKEWSNFSVQSAIWFPIGDDLQGNESQPFIDWDGAAWVTQVFNDFPIGSNFTLFTEIDLWIEDIGSSSDGDLNRVSTPATVIVSYFPNPKTTFYALTNFSPFWQSDFDYFAQAGVGAKYQVTSRFELEALYTGFTNKFLRDTNGRASTFNIGVRISG